MSILSKFSVKYPVTVTMLILAVSLLGYISYQKLGIDLFPDLNTPRIFVEVTSSEIPPGEMESKFVETIESQAIRQSGVVEVSSVSSTGISQVTVEYVWDQDMDAAFLDLQKALTSVSQDDDVEELTITQHDPNEAPVVVVAFMHETITDLDELRKLADNYIKNELVRLEGVADVELTGEEISAIEISTDNYKLDSYGLSLSGISSSISDYNNTLSGGTIEEEGTSYIVKGVGRLSSIEDFKGIVVGYEAVDSDDDSSDMSPIYLSDVATIAMVNQDPENIVTIDGERAIGLSIYKETKYNTVNTVNAVREALAKMENDLGGYSFVEVSNQGSFIEDAISEVQETALMGILLAVFILFIFLRKFGATIIVSLSIPISIIATFNLMYFQGLTLNIMTLGGLALGAGMLVDNAIVVIENIFRNHEQGYSAKDAAIKGSGQVIGAITASTVTTIVVFLPIVYINGASGELFKDQAWTVAFSLIASLVVAILFIPMLYAKYYGRREKGKEGTFKVLEETSGTDEDNESEDIEIKGYGRFLSKTLRYRVIVLLGALLLMLGGGYIASTIGSEFMPKSDSKEFTLEVELPEGTRLERTSNAVETLKTLMREVGGDDIKHIYSHVGPSNGLSGGETAIFEGDNNASIKVILNSDATVTSDQIAASINSVMDGNEDLMVTFSADQSVLSSVLGTSSSPIVVEVKGEDLDIITDITVQVKERLEKIEGLNNISTTIENGAPEIEVVVDRFKAGIYDLTVAEVVSQISSSLQGQDAGEVDIKGELKDITLRLPDVTLNELKNITIESSSAVLQLEEVADIVFSQAPRQIDRRNQVRIGSVMADLDRDEVLDRVVAEVEASLGEIDMPLKYSYDITGEEEQRQESMDNLAFAAMLSIILVYMVLASQFESLIHPFTILLTIPLAVVGAVLIFWILGRTLNIMAVIGVIMLVGIAVNDSIILVDRINQLKRAGASVRDAIVMAGQQRVRPIIMTTLTTILALFPLTLGIGESASLRSPMALAVIGGLVTSTLLTLVVIPCVYMVLDRSKRS